MAEARQRDEWSRMSVLLWLIANANRDPKKTKALKPSDFDPFAAEEAKEPVRRVGPKAAFKLLKAVFVDRQPERRP